MKSSVPSKFNDQIYSEASDWLIEFRSGDIDEAGRKRFYAWLCTSPEHMRAYLELAATWNEGSQLDPAHRLDDDLLQQALSEDNVVPLAEFQSMQPSNSPATSQNRESSTERNVEDPSCLATTSTRINWRVSLSAIAASAVVAMFGFWAYSERNTFTTNLGEQRSLELSDGSTVELNTQSKIRVRFSADRRIVTLVRGQAFFHVAKDKARPFIVESDSTKVRAVGTEFDVYRKATGTTVTVIEGRVAVLPAASIPYRAAEDAFGVSAEGTGLPNGKDDADRARFSPLPTRTKVSRETSTGSAAILPVGALDSLDSQRNEVSHGGGEGPSLANGSPSAGAGEFLLRAGEQAILTPQATVKPVQPDIAAATAWTQRHLIFQSATLTDVADEFNRYNSQKIVVKDPKLGSFHITAVFASTDPSSLIHFLQARPEIIVTEDKDGVSISRKIQ